MVIFDQIVKKAKGENKNILVIGAPRSGTHAVGAELANLTNAKYLREICRTSDNPTPLARNKKFVQHRDVDCGTNCATNTKDTSCQRRTTDQRSCSNR